MRTAPFLAASAMLCFATFLSATAWSQTYVGSYALGDGPSWNEDPPTMSCVEVCAMVYGGDPDDYGCGIDSEEMTRTAFADSYASDAGCEEPSPDTTKTPGNYDSTGDRSAYVADNCPETMNYCYEVGEDAGDDDDAADDDDDAADDDDDDAADDDDDDAADDDDDDDDDEVADDDDDGGGRSGGRSGRGRTGCGLFATPSHGGGAAVLIAMLAILAHRRRDA